MQTPCNIVGDSLQARSPLWDSNPCSCAVNHESIPSMWVQFLDHVNPVLTLTDNDAKAVWHHP